MKDYKFGLKVSATTTATRTPFVEYHSAGQGVAHNPYGISYFNDPSYMVSA